MVDVNATKARLRWDPVPKTSQPIFYVRRTDRLIARVKHLLYAYRFARQVGGVLAMVWPDLPAKARVFDGPNYYPWLIFDMDRFRERMGTTDLVFLPGSTPWQKDGPNLRGPEHASYRNNRFKRELFSSPDLVFYDDTLLQYRFEGEPTTREWMENEVRELFKLLPLTAEVETVLDQVRNELQGTDYSCVHFRAGDVYAMVKEALPHLLDGSLPESRLTLLLGHLVARTSPVEFFAPHIDRLADEGKPILFSSDSPEFLARFKARYGQARFIDLARFQAPEPIQKAMVDFCAIGGGRKVLGSRGNYGLMAAMLGGAEMVMVSAAGVTPFPPDEAIEQFHTCALELLTGGSPLPAAIDSRVRDEIARRYLYVNRLGDKEEIAALDPRPAIRTQAALSPPKTVG